MNPRSHVTEIRLQDSLKQTLSSHARDMLETARQGGTLYSILSFRTFSLLFRTSIQQVSLIRVIILTNICTEMRRFVVLFNLIQVAFRGAGTTSDFQIFLRKEISRSKWPKMAFLISVIKIRSNSIGTGVFDSKRHRNKTIVVLFYVSFGSDCLALSAVKLCYDNSAGAGFMGELNWVYLLKN